MKDFANTECAEHFGHQIEFAHRHAARKYQDIVGIEMEADAFQQLRLIVTDVIVCNARKAAMPQCGDDAVRIGTSNLMRRDRLAWFDQFIACRNDSDGGLCTDAHARHTSTGDDSDFRCIQLSPGAQQ